MPRPPRFPNADLIRVIAMLMVIILHTILNFTVRPDFFATKLYFLFEPVVAISKTCVLLFFMLSGFLLVTRRRTIRDNLLKTWRKIVLPLSFFAMVNSLLDWSKLTHGERDFLEFVTQAIHFPSSPLWFLVVLAFLYLLNPLWQLVLDQRQKQNQRLARLLTLFAFIFTISTTLVEYLLKQKVAIFNNFTAWTGFLFFYLYGGLVRNKWINIGKARTNLIVVAGGILLTMAGDILTMWQNAQGTSSILSNYTSAYQSIPVTLTAMALFNYLIQVDLSRIAPVATRLMTWLAKLSFGIYLLHPYIISLLIGIGFDFNQLGVNVYLYNLLNICLVFSTSLLLTLLLQKLPKIKAVIGG